MSDTFARLAACAAIMALLAGCSATDPGTRNADGSWNVTCGIPASDHAKEDSADFPAEGADMGGYRGHRKMRSFARDHSDGGVAEEIWILSDEIGWWLLSSKRAHPDDLVPPDDLDSTEDRLRWLFETIDGDRYRLIIESPFLAEPVVVAADDEDAALTVADQVWTVFLSASLIRCASR